MAILFLLAISCGGYGAYLVRVHSFRRRAAELEGTVARRTEQLTRAIEQADRLATAARINKAYLAQSLSQAANEAEETMETDTPSE